MRKYVLETWKLGVHKYSSLAEVLNVVALKHRYKPAEQSKWGINKHRAADF